MYQASEAAASTWVSKDQSLPPVQFSGYQVTLTTSPSSSHPTEEGIEQELSESSELVVAGQVRERLHLAHLSPQQVGASS